ncbi:MAG: cupin domain-containing protein [Spirochaetales bacterium]|nr:cupin domain-containing protein [Spirochaetales bacterium]
MFNRSGDEGYEKSDLGFERKTLVWGNKTLMTEFRLKSGKELPIHKHPYEQTGYLVSGRINLKIGGERYETFPGDSWVVPENVEHGAEILEDAVAIEIFSPVREDYLP